MNERLQRPRSARSDHLTLMVLALLFVIWAIAFIHHQSFVAIDANRYYPVFDDALISMRYAWNIAHGAGAVWNPGEYVEGYTNPAMVLLMSLVSTVADKRIVPLVFQCFGVGFILANAFLVAGLVRYVNTDEDDACRARLLRIAAFAGVLMYYPLVFMSLSAMETGLLAPLLAGGVLLTFRYSRAPRPWTMTVLAGCLGLAYLTRPDALIVVGVLFCYLWVFCRRQGFSAKPVYWGAVAVGALVVSHVIARYGYYGEILPNTYYLKATGMPLGVKLANGFAYLGHLLKDHAGFVGLSAVSFVLAVNKEKMLLAFLAAMALAYQVWVGGDMTPHWRMVTPVLAPLMVLAADGALRLASMLMSVVDPQPRAANRLRRVAGWMVPIAAALLIGLSLSVYWSDEGDAYFGAKQKVLLLVGCSLMAAAAPRMIGIGSRGRTWLRGLAAFGILLIAVYLADRRYEAEWTLAKMPRILWKNVRDVNTAIILDRVLTREATVGLEAAGGIPYYTDLDAIDFLGKTDSYVSRLEADISGERGWFGLSSVPGHNKYDLEYSIKQKRPTFVETVKIGQHDLRHWAESNYVAVRCADVTLRLLKDSPMVKWEKVEALDLANVKLNSTEPFNWGI